MISEALVRVGYWKGVNMGNRRQKAEKAYARALGQKEPSGIEVREWRWNWLKSSSRESSVWCTEWRLSISPITKSHVIRFAFGYRVEGHLSWWDGWADPPLRGSGDTHQSAWGPEDTPFMLAPMLVWELIPQDCHAGLCFPGGQICSWLYTSVWE